MNDSWLDPSDAPWLRQTTAAANETETPSPFTPDHRANRKGYGNTDDRFDHHGYRRFFGDTD